MAFDDILEHLGEFGTYQKRAVAFMFLISVPGAWHKFAQVFFAAEIDYWCATPENPSSINCTLDEVQCIDILRNQTILQYEEQYEIGSVNDKCTRHYGTENNATIECETGWIYDHTQYEFTIIEDVSIVQVTRL